MRISKISLECPSPLILSVIQEPRNNFMVVLARTPLCPTFVALSEG
ncbi:MAG: hypothetical protein ACOYLG_05950 [Chitinophagaceae bacterium]